MSSEAQRRASKRYAQSEKGKAFFREAAYQYRLRNAKKAKARSDVTQAVREGRLIPQPCLFCFAPKAEAHHHDYDQPLNVTWMCRPCHNSFHNLLTKP